MNKFRETWPEIHRFSREEIRAFFRVCSDRRMPAREEALGLLLYPEGADLPGYYARLLAYLAENRIPIREIPSELLQVFFELIASSGKLPQNPALKRFFHAAVERIPRKLLPWLFQKRYAVGLFFEFMGKRFIRRGGRTPDFRNRWRIFRKLLAVESVRRLHDPSLEITIADLGPLLAGSKPAWRKTAKNLVRRAGKPAPRLIALSGLYWGGQGNRTLAFWEQLVDAQAGEFEAVRQLAEGVSRDTGRVVLSWHNASLAAAGGWGFDDFSERFTSLRHYRDFARSVRQTAARILEDLDKTSVSSLFEMRARRILAPKAVQALEHVRALRELDSSFKAQWREMSRKAAVLLGPDEIDAIDSGRKTEWSGALAPHQQVSLERVLAWLNHSREIWTEGLALYFALAIRGGEAIESGMVSSFVLPWIDKFFISSRRRADQGYLEELFGLVASCIDSPLILFWEDTAHARLPSFGLALGELAGRGLPFRGVGIFDTLGSMRSDAAEIIHGDYPNKLLFALRPLSDAHFAGKLRLFDTPPSGFPGSYDSSWKDNLVFIYTGTQVFPLLSVQTEMESVCPWLSDGRARYPFGSWFRERLRSRVLGVKSGPPDPLAHCFSTWANLL